MANINIFYFISEASRHVKQACADIEGSSSYEEGKNEMRKLIGYLDGATTFLNTLVVTGDKSTDTASIDELIDSWLAEGYESLIYVADATKQEPETIHKLCSMRDEIQKDIFNN